MGLLDKLVCKTAGGASVNAPIKRSSSWFCDEDGDESLSKAPKTALKPDVSVAKVVAAAAAPGHNDAPKSTSLGLSDSVKQILRRASATTGAQAETCSTRTPNSSQPLAVSFDESLRSFVSQLQSQTLRKDAGGNVAIRYSADEWKGAAAAAAAAECRGELGGEDDKDNKDVARTSKKGASRKKDSKNELGEDMAQLSKIEYDFRARQNSVSALQNARFTLNTLGSESVDHVASAILKNQHKSGGRVASFKRLKLKSKKKGGFNSYGSKWMGKNRVYKFSRVSSAKPMASRLEARELDEDTMLAESTVDIGIPKAKNKKNQKAGKKTRNTFDFVGSESENDSEDGGDGDGDELQKENDEELEETLSKVVEAFHQAFLRKDHAAIDAWISENLLHVCRELFGIDEFREGQYESFFELLHGRSVLSVLPTGQGKSLLFQIASVLLPSLVIVISPLISLLQDQEEKLPPFIDGVFFFGELVRKQRKALFDHILDNCASSSMSPTVVFLSPERFVSGEFQNLLKQASGHMSNLLVCIDEAHCISEWSHNFRSSYLRLGSAVTAVKKSFECVQILALTGSATVRAQQSIKNVLFPSHPEECAVVSCAQSVRDNAVIRIYLTEDKRKALDKLFLEKESELHGLTSVMVYVSFQHEADSIAAILRSSGIRSDSYHAGKTSAARNRVQENFMSGKLHVVVCTVAFGMGIHKEDVRAVVHYGLPRSLEGYVQESGRGGRDGKPYFSIVIFEKKDFGLLRSLCFSSAVDLRQVQQLFFHIPKLAAFDGQYIVDIMDVEKQLALPRYSVDTMLAYACMEAPEYFRDPIFETVSYDVSFRSAAPEALASTFRVAAGIAATSQCRYGTYNTRALEVCKHQKMPFDEFLFELESMSEAGNCYLKRASSGCIVTFKCSGKVSAQMARVAETVHQRISAIETSSVHRLQAIYSLMSKFANREEDVSAQFQSALNDYFTLEAQLQSVEMDEHIGETALLITDIKAVLHQMPRDGMNAITVSKIMHGIPSPQFPMASGALETFWGEHVNVPFEQIKLMASKIIQQMDIVDLAGPSRKRSLTIAQEAILQVQHHDDGGDGSGDGSGDGDGDDDSSDEDENNSADEK
eukprot:ANDGO_06179.mRNA.1 ATP-dependent DNA helicase Q-like 5